MQAHFERLTQSLAQFLGVESQAGEGETRILFDFKEFPVLVEYQADACQVLLATSVAELAEKNRAALYLALLQGQYLFHGTVGATLAVDEEARFAVLQIVKDIETLTPENFPVLMENFLRAAEDWREFIENFGEQATPTPTATAGISFNPGSMLRA
ncbi:MAG: type III secretion system chaperone [Candidatus Accumulibacter sp.]|jgi:hypothetical protein|nr:type III secretion system chaperone [Accumulibacter sp.]